jgi:pimeloyl-ACP methyl ester carboxylesterase
MRRNSLSAAHPNPAATRMLWLPGAYNSPEDFVRAGFGDAVARRGLALDLEFIDLELRYLGDERALMELRDEVVRPLQQAGIAVWLGGISLGGLLALHFATSVAVKLAGLCLLAPYMGNRMLIEEIVQAPGLQRWQPGEIVQGDAERQVWRYLKEPGEDALPIYLGFGRQDRFAAGLQLLADNLAPKSVHVIEGGHDWRTWAMLWENFLDTRFA